MKIAIYAGAFDPPTLAHLDIIARASEICDSLIVCVGKNHLKANSLIPLSSRLELLAKLVEPFKNVKIATTDLLLADFAHKNQAAFLIRGLRSIDDFESEYALSTANRDLSGIDTLFLMSKPEFRHISSSLVREIHHFNGKVDHLVPSAVKNFL